MKSGLNNLGEELFRHGNISVREHGIIDNEKTMLWEDIETMFVEATQHFRGLVIPVYASMKVHIVCFNGLKTSLKLGSLVVMSSKKKKGLEDIYEFIVSKIVDRQMHKVISDLKNGQRVYLGAVYVTQEALHFPKFFGGYDVVELNRIAGCNFDMGDFVISFVDDNGRLKHKKWGEVAVIPNIHLIRLFLSTLAKHNLTTA